MLCTRSEFSVLRNHVFSSNFFTFLIERWFTVIVTQDGTYTSRNRSLTSNLYENPMVPEWVRIYTFVPIEVCSCGCGSLKKGTQLQTSWNTFSHWSPHHSSWRRQVLLAERSSAILDVMRSDIANSKSRFRISKTISEIWYPTHWLEKSPKYVVFQHTNILPCIAGFDVRK